MPAGSLKDAADATTALALIRQYTDGMLSAGFTYTPPSGAPAEPAGKKPETPAAPAQGDTLSLVMARLDAMEQRHQQAEAAQFQSMMNAVDQRLLAEIDTWASPKYGTSKDRNFNQLKAARELRELVNTQVAGYTARGMATPMIETVLRQVRAFHDADHAPAPKTAAAPLGSPGAGVKVGENKPRNIHEAVFAGK